ncbi:MAG: sigma-54-dependent transcriptional regulator, partial [Pontibacterium sp.]
LERKGGINNILTCSDSRQALSMLAKNTVGLVLLDLTMPHISGMDLLKIIREEYPSIAVIVISGLNNVDSAVTSLKHGAFDYFVKTSEEDRLLEGIKRAILMQQIRFENSTLKSRMLDDRLSHPEAFEGIASRSKAINAIFHYIESIAASQQPVLFVGETGTGRERLARACHEVSKRSGPMLKVSTEGLDDDAFEALLCGHAPGILNDPFKSRRGLIEQATNGTLFIDNIGSLSLQQQAIVLSLLQDELFYPVGASQPLKARVRIIASASAGLKDQCDEGTFRKDLFYRLNGQVIEVPALRARKDDIPVLLDFFIEKAAESLGKPIPSYPRELPVLLYNYDFPDNVSELRSLVYEAVSHHRSHLLSMDVFKAALDKDVEPLSTSPDPVTFNPDLSLPTLSAMNDMLVVEAMKRAENNQSLASRMLGISQPALSKRLKKLGESQKPDDSEGKI